MTSVADKDTSNVTWNFDEPFTFARRARCFPIVDARPLRWPRTTIEASELIDDWQTRAGSELGRYKLSKATMRCIASHTSRKNGTCPLTDRALSLRSGRSIPSTKRDVCRLKKMGYLIAEIDVDKGYRKRSRVLVLAIPDRLDEDQRIPGNGDQRISPARDHGWGSTYPTVQEQDEMALRIRSVNERYNDKLGYTFGKDKGAAPAASATSSPTEKLITATGPNGEKVVLRNGRWEKM